MDCPRTLQACITALLMPTIQWPREQPRELAQMQVQPTCGRGPCRLRRRSTTCQAGALFQVAY